VASRVEMLGEVGHPRKFGGCSRRPAIGSLRA
jgi:hypothetical protein